MQIEHVWYLLNLYSIDGATLKKTQRSWFVDKDSSRNGCAWFTIIILFKKDTLSYVWKILNYEIISSWRHKSDDVTMYISTPISTQIYQLNIISFDKVNKVIKVFDK